MPRVRFYYDVVCPYSYLETHAIEAAEDARSVEVEWLPFACLWAGGQGRLRDFKHALYEAFFCEGEDIAVDRELASAAARVGLDPDAAVAAAYSAERFERIREIRREAETVGVRGVPTLLTEDGRSHWGMGGLERLLAGEALVPRTA